ncbi:P-loop containing nucleoside triphosphate hydrolase protein [Gamsiella multidivaricata]|uniref:P-loop containing nucleoside triphosphate hydrolase protein n=1 Tax=Gamsiella multidivaricata TaxID=101098 RepID=UPI00221F46BB|nr:P-loop containing nucleoside triphosphate hydrolase protein [Gamsiella multidivaricata]KAG0352069.1 nucleolar DEAD-box protein required for synthesis of 60S ribosomal subunit [Gamsiella multidivaricata]KAI7828677.1 P-loop containing nucleoside triphosphate hydrolase protein [Gamsiella multidivaricata]
MSNDFVMTIDDDDESVPFLDEEELDQEEVVTKKKSKKNKKGSNQVPKDTGDLDPNFSFDTEGGGHMGAHHDWDFTAARAALRAQDEMQPGLSLDEIIARKRAQVKAKKSGKIVAPVEEEKEINEDDESEFQEASDSDEEGDENDMEGIKFDEDDEDNDDDGFGAGRDEDAGLEDNEAEAAELEDESEEESEDEESEGSESEDEEEEEENDSDDEEEETEYQKERKKAYFAPESDTPVDVAETFATMNLSRPILKGLAQVGFVQPTQIQARTIPVALMGKDICGGAVTGSGKTAAFVVPVLERLLYRSRQTATSRVLILCPTRELAIQCHSVAQKLASFTDITFGLCVGGLSRSAQEIQLRTRPDVLIATPGRLIDHILNSRSFTLDHIDILIMDEADRMLEDGFSAELTEIVKACPQNRQTMLFSATMTDNVDELIRMSLNRPVRLQIDASNATAARLIQEFVRIRHHREEDRPAVLLALCSRTFKRRVIIFFRSKAAAHQMKMIFGLMGLRAAELHGNLTQEQRLASLEEFRDERVDFLLATDLASRGLDIKGIDTVINFNMPQNYSIYQHRVGRTARAGRNGRAVTLAGENDRKLLKMAIKNADKKTVKHRVIPQDVITRYRERVEGLTESVKEIMAEEKEDKVLRQAEMEMKKSQNLLKHEDEIYSRPAKTWFQTTDEKKLAADKGKAALNDPKKRKAVDADAPKRDRFAGMSRAKRRRLQLTEEDHQDINSHAKSIKSAKKALKPNKIPKLAPEKVATKPQGQKKKKKKDVDFSRDLADASKQGVAAAKKLGGGSKFGKDKKDEKKERGGKLGKLRGNKSFKSSKKYKRR